MFLSTLRRDFEGDCMAERALAADLGGGGDRPGELM